VGAATWLPSFINIYIYKTRDTFGYDISYDYGLLSDGAGGRGDMASISH
jgi:hypothetical protein